ncbi:hypothetical protein FOC4_g10005897 [Fusarium odoratissimum]|uniref:Uncharacterized protein n=3 Tax=Fusarium oxysporum species complex TaxID=171631 RepID=N1RME8_FUSC4|nr:hypothetical protein FOC4_g10005897 [Fusarium odoratissimum]TXB95596.1 hypothetical protein FocTR4_00015864 [Fusarium oxysporum f. sp. cubense]
MTTVISASGNSAVTSSFIITYTRGSTTMKPRSATELSGWIHFPMPGGTSGECLDNLMVDFTSQSATIKTVMVYLGSANVFEEGNLGKTETFTVSMSSRKILHSGGGISVSIEVEFETVEAWLSISSVGIAF